MAKKAALSFLILLSFLAVFRDLIANGKPLYCEIGGESYWPGLHTAIYGHKARFKSPALAAIAEKPPFEAWKDFSLYDKTPVFAPIPFSPGEYSKQHESSLLPPGATQPGLDARFKHLMGTDNYGRDVAATLVSGARIALLTGSVAMGMALLLGLVLGTVAGFFGDDRLRTSRARLWATLLAVPVGFFYAFMARQYELAESESQAVWWASIGIFIGIVLVFNMLGKWLATFPWLGKQVLIPADLAIMRLAEVFNALPKLIVIIALSVAMRRQHDSIWLLIALIGAMSWTGVARFVRAEMLRIRAMDYVAAARGLGLPEWKVLLRHALPNAMRPVWVAVSLGVASAVLLEASLSFLGFGGEALKGISWGSLLARESAQTNPAAAWWVMLPPGLMICLTVLSLKQLSDKD